MALIITPHKTVKTLSYNEQEELKVLAKKYGVFITPVVSSICGSWTGSCEGRNQLLKEHPELLK